MPPGAVSVSAGGDALALEEVNAVVTRALVLPDPSEIPQKEEGGGWGGVLKGHSARAEELLRVPDALFEEECEEELRSEDWLVFSSGLWFRCKAEAHRSKTVERACLQLHALGDQAMGGSVSTRLGIKDASFNPINLEAQQARLCAQTSIPRPVADWASSSPSTFPACGNSRQKSVGERQLC